MRRQHWDAASNPATSPPTLTAAGAAYLMPDKSDTLDDKTGIDARGWLRQRSRSLWLMLGILAPVLFVLWRISLNLRNIPYWDEFDSVFALLLQVDDLIARGGLLEAMWAIQNEHRMLTSRALFVLSYLLTGKINFVVIGWIGNLFFLGLLVTLVWSGERRGAWRLPLACVLALGMVHLLHGENYFWSGSSIDHFQVPMLAALAFWGLEQKSKTGYALAVLAAMAGTCTLLHGLLIWVVGGIWLLVERRWWAGAIWGGLAVCIGGLYFADFMVNPQHSMERARDFVTVIQYWLYLLGAVVSGEHAQFSMVLGAGFVLWAVSLAWRGVVGENRVMAAMIVFCLLALGAIAIGRVGVATEGFRVVSRYMVLANLVLVLLAWLEFKSRPTGAQIGWRLGALVAAMLVLNVTSNLTHIGKGRRFAEQRDRSLVYFQHYGHFKDTDFKLYPIKQKADNLLAEVISRRVYTPPITGQPVEFTRKQEVGGVKYYFDDIGLKEQSLYARGWGFVPNQIPKRGHTFLVLKSKQRFLIFKTVSITREDVVSAQGRPELALAGFRTTITRDRIPPDDYQIGLLFRVGDSGYYTMTDHRLDLKTTSAPSGPKG
jgi:hypothetical protein